MVLSGVSRRKQIVAPDDDEEELQEEIVEEEGSFISFYLFWNLLSPLI